MIPAQKNNPIEVFDRRLSARNRARHASKLPDHDFLFEWCSRQLLERLSLIKRDFHTIAQIGARDTHAPQALAQQSTPCTILDSAQSPATHIIADPEALPLKPGSQDLILSNLELHGINDIPGTLLQIRNALKPDGLFLATLFGSDTLHQLKDCLLQAELEIKGGASPRIAPFPDKQDCGALIQRAGFALPVVDSETVTVTYDNMFKLLQDIRFMGEANTLIDRSKTFTPRSVFMRAAELYRQRYTEAGTGRIEATFNIVFLLGWAPHENQQKPLQPGSAQTSLADALGTTETKTGEKP